MANISDYGSAGLPPEGHAHPAVLIGFVDLGVQESKFGASRQGHLTFELLDETTSDGKVILAHKRIFNLSARSRNFREVLRALTGLHDVGSIETRDLLGGECCLAIEHVTTDTGTYADVEVKPLRGKPSGRLPRTSMTFLSMHPSDFEERALADLPEWQCEKIRASETYKTLIADLKFAASAKGKPAAGIIDDDFPENLGGAPKSKKRAA